MSEQEESLNLRTLHGVNQVSIKVRVDSQVSHDLRTPLNSIIGFSEVLMDGLAGELNAEQKTLVKRIHKSGRALLRFVEDLLQET